MRYQKRMAARLPLARCACLCSRVHRIPMQEKCTVMNISSRHGDHEKEELLTFMAHLWAPFHRALENRTAIWIMFSSAPQSCELLSFHAHAQLLMSVITCKNASTKSRRLLAYMPGELLILLAFIVDSLFLPLENSFVYTYEGFTFERFNSCHVVASFKNRQEDACTKMTESVDREACKTTRRSD